jgi:hypothetical protein
MLAQISTSTISGAVTDAQGLVVAAARVVATNESTGVTYETKTSSSGDYTLSSLPPGFYKITVVQQGFQSFESVHNPLTVGVPLVVNAALQVGQVSQTVQVESTYARVETTNAMVSDVVTRRAVAELPLNGRNPLNLVVLEPGVVQRSNNATGSGTHVFGSRDRAHNVTIDGIDANESSVPNPQSNVFRLNSDNVQEYRVVTHNATADFGRNSGANVAMATRAGGSEFHGDVYWYHRNTAFNANDSFNNSNPRGALPRPVLLLHQYGGDLGGPIIKNKTFFFGSWQNNHIIQTQPISKAFGQVPKVYTDTLKNAGIFRYFKGSQNSPTLVDPATGNLLPGVRTCFGSSDTNCVATYDIFGSDLSNGGVGADPAMKTMIAKFPSPNTFTGLGDGLNFAGYNWNPRSQFTGPFLLGRIDHKFNENNNLSGTLLWSKWDTRQGDFVNSRPAVFPGFPPTGEVFRSSQLLSVSYRRALTPQLVNNFTTGFSRFDFFFSLVESNTQGGNVPPPYGQQCFGGSSLRNVHTPFCNTPHNERAVSNIQFIDDLSYIRGAHTFRVGENIRMYRHNDQRGAPGGFNEPATIIFDRTARGKPSGFPSADGINATDNNNLENAIVELLGIPGRVQQAFFADVPSDTYTTALSVQGTRAKQLDLYAQDEWKIKNNLTLTLGARWEYNRPPRDCCGRTFVPNRALDGSQGLVTFVPANSWWTRSNANAVGPRLGLAWDPKKDGKTVVRAGYGIAFDTLSTFQVTAVGGKVPGISALQCRVTPGVAGAPGDPCAPIPSPLRLSPLLAALNPFTLTPQSRPSANLSPQPTPLGAAPDVGAFDPNLQMPTVHEWSLTVQRQLPLHLVAQVGYIGKRGTHLFRAYDLNQYGIASAFAQDFLNAQQNLFICRNNAAACRLAQMNDGISAANITLDNFANFGLAGQVNLPTLSRLLGSGGTPAPVLSSQYRGGNAGFVVQNGLGDLADQIDRQTGTSSLTTQGFAANYFRPNPQFGQSFYFDSGGDSYFHGMIVQLRRQFEGGLDLGFSYTLSKSIDDMSIDPVGASSGGALSTTNSRTPTDVHNFLLDRGRSDFDNRHVVVLNALYELPFGQGKRWGTHWPAFMKQVLGGWSATGIYVFQSGEPFSFNSGLRTVHNTHQSRPVLKGPLPAFSLQNVGTIQGPVFVRAEALNNNQNDPNFDCRQVTGTQSFLCIPPPGQSGMGRNTIQGPGYWNIDMGILKNFQLTERLRLQFRSEFFNALNHPNYENPRNASNGSPTLTSSTFGLTCCSQASVPSSSTIIATGEPSRVIQFALKLSF